MVFYRFAAGSDTEVWHCLWLVSNDDTLGIFIFIVVRHDAVSYNAKCLCLNLWARQWLGAGFYMSMAMLKYCKKYPFWQCRNLSHFGPKCKFSYVLTSVSLQLWCKGAAVDCGYETMLGLIKSIGIDSQTDSNVNSNLKCHVFLPINAVTKFIF